MNAELQEHLANLHAELEELERVVNELLTEIERLKVYETEVRTRTWNEVVLQNELYKSKSLITKLADALVYLELTTAQQLPYHDNTALIQRAREATK